MNIKTDLSVFYFCCMYLCTRFLPCSCGIFMVSMLSIFVWLSIVLIAMVLVYSLCLFLGVGFFYLIRSKEQVLSSVAQKKQDSISVDVLIPAYNEGKVLLGAIDSIVNQDFLGNLNIHVLLGDQSDSSVAFLGERFGPVDSVVQVSDTRLLYVHYQGCNPKREKVNKILGHLNPGHYCAFLDADHIACSDWITEAVRFLQNSSSRYIGVQSRRGAIKTKSLFQIWDSLQNHIGNEFFNKIIYRLFGRVFFTGTTAVFRPHSQSKLSLDDSLTEDTALSYRLFSLGYYISYLPKLGSRESVSPRSVDYIGRRRRWSQGHTGSFIRYFSSVLFNADVSYRSRLLYLFHGLYYLVPVLAFIVYGITQFFIFFQLPIWAQYVVLGLGILLSCLCMVGILGLRKSWKSDFFVGIIIFVPFVSDLFLWYIKVQKYPFYDFIISYPFMNTWLGDILLLTFSLPLLYLIISLFDLRFLSKRIGTSLLFYPWIVFIDLYSVLLGVCDLFLGIKKWPLINRRDARLSYQQLVSGLIIFGLLLGVLWVGRRTYDSCFVEAGSEPYTNSIFSLHNPWRSHTLEKYISEVDGGLTVTIKGEVDEVLAGKDIVLDYNNQDVFLVEVDNTGSYEFSWEEEIGFETRTARLRSPDHICGIDFSFSTHVVAFDDRGIYLNGESFLVKGMVPTFQQPHLKKTTQEGFQELHELGVNALRYYHQPGKDIFERAHARGLMLVPQINQSNWNQTDIDFRSWRGLYHRFRSMLGDVSMHPSVLFVNTGNELEIRDRNRVPVIIDLLKNITENHNLHQPMAYATFTSYVEYPADILLVNMLDTGSVYWNKALSILSQFKTPVLAGELGGFAAFTERTTEPFRMYRLQNQWRELMSLGFGGGFVFHSHDNWAQPVPVGNNDPFDDEHPDDVRGIWDRDNQKKQIYSTVQGLFQDLELSFVSYDEGYLNVFAENIRPYTISDLTVSGLDKEYYSFGDVLPGERVFMRLLVENVLYDDLFWEYSTHSGLDSRVPVFDTSIDGVIYDSPGNLYVDDLGDVYALGDVGFISPALGGLSESRFGYLQNMEVDPIISVHDLKIEDVSGALFGIGSVGVGQYSIRFRLPAELGRHTLLVLEGLGSRNFTLSHQGQSHVFESHPYRETGLNLQEYFDNIDYTSEFILGIDRRDVQYLNENDSPSGAPVLIDFQSPYLFHPLKTNIGK